ncbi:DUF58 domain-containing protein [Cupriavidus basilensis]|uniref:DUF58 domain-containing protein n=1 Tax=Cupriavidus basilensis TaxID=68895 RepID=A0ABT6ALN1_9BURK|nr:DUF58 domain-containing protein [Cupriavidus basilensis]MDF3833513.1 DUF58 domain-containing protein [Cupriavidus basilensis]
MSRSRLFSTPRTAAPPASGRRRLAWASPPWLQRPRTPRQGVVTLDRRHLYILPSRAGLGFAALLMVMLLTSLNYNISLGFALTFLLGGIGMACMWQAYRNLLDMTVAGAGATPAFAGEPAAFSLRIAGADAPVRIGIEASLPARAGALPASLSLARDATGLLTLHLPTTRRGWLALPRVTLSSRFPLGLFRVWSHADLPLAALVYPRPEAGAPPLPFAAQPDDDGIACLPSDDGIDQLRRYRSGDPLHRIAWKHSARTGRWLSRTGQAGSQPAYWLDWQSLPPAMAAEARLSRLCAWVLAAGEMADIGLRLPGVDIPPGHGGAHRRACLEALALWPGRPGQAMPEAPR